MCPYSENNAYISLRKSLEPQSIAKFWSADLCIYLEGDLRKRILLNHYKFVIHHYEMSTLKVTSHKRQL